MPIVKIKIPFYLPNRIYRFLKRKYFPVKQERGGLYGDRDVEWSFIAAHIPKSGTNALDFGSGESYAGLIAAFRGFQVTALDLEPRDFAWKHPMFNFIQGDLFKSGFKKNYFDLIINCSSIEHAGLAGRYGVEVNRPDADLEAMAYLRELMTPAAVMLLTIPIGQDECFSPMCRVYGKQRLPRLLERYKIGKEIFWVKDALGHWVISDKEAALGFKASAGSSDPSKNIYALGCFVLEIS